MTRPAPSGADRPVPAPTRAPRSASSTASSPASAVPSRRALLGAGGLLASGLLAACGAEPAAPEVPKGPKAAKPFPVVDADQIARVMTEVSAAVTAADEAHDAGRLAPRVVGTAAEIRSRAYEIIGTVPEFQQTLSTPTDQVVVPITSVDARFPRQAIAMVRVSAAEAMPCFVALQQQDARSPYVTWGWASLISGDDLPQVNDSATGAEAVAADAEGLVLAPKDALALYADVLSGGDGKDPEDKIETDKGQQATHAEIQAERASLSQGVAPNAAATISESYSVQDGEYLGLRTADGGALVIGTMRSTRTMTVQPQATVSYPESVLTKLAGTATFTKEFVRDSAEVVVMHIPTADSGDRIRTIAASKSLLGAHGS